MQNAFAKHITSKKLFTAGNKLLLAISGGIDSVVLAHLLKDFGADFCLAHCNFKLRGADSDADEQFCKDLARKLGVEIYTTHFDVKSYCTTHAISVQMAARDLRYKWFDVLLSSYRLDYVLTAHHANDSIETLFINLLRGTGINGLKGITEKGERLIRPLLPFTKNDLEKYAAEHKIDYRADKSNREEKYERNFLRLTIIPALKKVNPGLEHTILNNIRNFKEEAEIVTDFLKEKAKAICTKKGNYYLLNKSLLKKEKQIRSVLHYLLDPFEFNATQIDDILNNINSNGLVGKVFQSPGHELTIDREYILVKSITEEHFSRLSITSLDDLKKNGLLGFTKINTFSLPQQNEIILDADRLVFPLSIRVSVRGDKFRPFGMRGFKLLSDFFKDEKLNKFEKDNCKLLVNGNGDIIWVMGYRSDERYRVNATEKNLIKLTLN